MIKTVFWGGILLLVAGVWLGGCLSRGCILF